MLVQWAHAFADRVYENSARSWIFVVHTISKPFFVTEMKRYLTNLLFLALCFCTILTVSAQEQEAPELLKHRIAVYYGNTFVPDAYTRPTADFTSIGQVGLNYEFRFSELFGLGLNGGMELEGYYLDDDRLTERENAMLAVLLGYFHFGEDFGIYLGPGLELLDGESQLLARVGFQYRFHPGKGWDITPQMWYDYKESHQAIVLGIGVGRSF